MTKLPGSFRVLFTVLTIIRQDSHYESEYFTAVQYQTAFSSTKCYFSSNTGFKHSTFNIYLKISGKAKSLNLIT